MLLLSERWTDVVNEKADYCFLWQQNVTIHKCIFWLSFIISYGLPHCDILEQPLKILLLEFGERME